MSYTEAAIPAQVIGNQSILAEIAWFQTLCAWRVAHASDPADFDSLPPPAIGPGTYADFVARQGALPAERLVIALCLATQLDPRALQAINLPDNPGALILYQPTGSLLPTIGSALYLLCGDNLAQRLKFRHLFQAEHWFYKKSVLDIGDVAPGVPEFVASIALTAPFSDLFIHNRYRRPRFSPEFPAHLLETEMTWDDLILNPGTRKRLDELKQWFAHDHVLARDPKMGRHYKQGYRCLFSGPSGTGKSLAASLLGKHLGRDVFRVDLSAVISKYIGETSKNLNALFETAEDKDWILFFDEGDALFGKRVDTAAADNKNATFANQDVAFLLQRIETFRGVVIVATNFRKNMDEAFSRRFNQVVTFDIPDGDNALRMWREYLPACVRFPADLDLETLVRRQSLSCAGIINVLQRVTVLTVSKGAQVIAHSDLDFCILDETSK
jgi:hypothetical protein